MSINVPLKKAISDSGLKHGFIANQAGINRFRLSRIVNGRVNPTANEKVLIAGVLRRPLADVFPPEGVAA